jgi:hypothetical protein
MKPQFTITEALVERVMSNDPRWIVVRCGWLEDVAVQFGAIANLPDGWDGDGALRPDVRSLEAAWGLLTSLCRAEEMTRPHVNPTRSGGVQLEWENGSRYFEIEVVAERAATYLYRDSDSSLEDTGEIFEGEPLYAITQYIRQVEAGIRHGSPQASKSTLGYESVEAVA